ncbi:hypothetical protein A2368_01925 [Candidatus Collierbacteria bacterium RIFOXYB1_FULL_49_13]|uniref:Phosphoglycerate mutase n=1 Tax=Candidatus Collierbacteria bacterium RIFOXYB1_FULL_49_13 TaxID=1817728 RepID=A0A1F5FG72_9BACT|nr:MAG: hypothetical protein A2368_01925 [Candidatus Collierbacteria bacterium RIFOXYB1_FULL_49_13]
MKQIILVRHPETKSQIDEKTNKYKMPDPEISETGLRQLDEINSYLNEFDYDVIFTSLYRRTRESASKINRLNRPVLGYNAFNEYYNDPTGKGTESVENAIVRTMTKIYSLFDIYQRVVVIGHSSINKTILQTILNCEYTEAGKYFNNFGEVQVMRYDWQAGDKTWQIVDSFIPKQS